jgi:hypothetical protein
MTIWRKITMRSIKNLAMCVVVFFWLSQAPVQAGGRPMELKWSELAPIISGHNVELLAPGAIRIKGEVVSVREDALVIDVRKTSDPKSYPKGSMSLSRSSVGLLKLNRSRGSWGRGIGTAVGALCGITVGGYLAVMKTNSAGAGIPTFVGISSGITIAGYSLGRVIDKRITEIKVVP